MKKGFKYYIEDEKIREYRKLSPEEKLKWLEEINRFSEMVMSDKAKRIREMLRKAEI